MNYTYSVIEKSRRMQDYKRARCETDTQQGPVLCHLKPLYSGHVLLINLNLRWRSLVLVVKKKDSWTFAEKMVKKLKVNFDNQALNYSDTSEEDLSNFLVASLLTTT